VRGARIDEVREPELTDVPQSLELGRIHDPHGCGIEPNRIPERIPDRFPGDRSAHGVIIWIP
jgi:hypothetical protein